MSVLNDWALRALANLQCLFCDEDWGLRLWKKKYWNVWIPEIKYLHVKPLIGGDRSQFQIKKDHARVENYFMPSGTSIQNQAKKR